MEKNFHKAAELIKFWEKFHFLIEREAQTGQGYTVQHLDKNLANKVLQV